MVVFRVDANSTVATGHLYRCLSIAKRCREIGLSCLFLLADPDYAGMIEEAGFPFKVLDLRFDDWDYHVSLVKEEISLVKASCLVVDSYRVTKNFFHELHEFIPIFYLDDLCREVYEVSAVLHYSEWEDDNILTLVCTGADPETGDTYGTVLNDAGADGKYASFCRSVEQSGRWLDGQGQVSAEYASAFAAEGITSSAVTRTMKRRNLDFRPSSAADWEVVQAR